MDYIIWYMLGLALILSAHAQNYDQGYQTFYNPLTTVPEIGNSYVTKDVLSYLTPYQVNALEAGGALVRPQNSEDEREYQADEEEEQEEEEDDDQSAEQEQNNTEQQEIQESDQNSVLKEIFKILNKHFEENSRDTQKINLPQGKSQSEEESEGDEEERGEQNQSEEEVEEKELENTRQIPARFGFRQRQNSEKYPESSVLTKQKEQAKNTYIRHQPNYRKSPRYQEYSNKKQEKRREGNRQEPQEYLQKKTKFIPVEETPEEENTQQGDVAQEILTRLRKPTWSKDHVVQAIAQHRGKLIRDELQLQTFLQELKEAPRYNNQKIAIEIEKLRENLKKQNALARAAVLAKSSTFLNK